MSCVVSVVMPCFNSSRFISESIESVLAQTFSDWELIIVDDCSTDNSVEVVQSFVARDSRIKLIQLAENSGAAVARNAAIEAAQGRYIAFLDSDDLWDADFLDKSIDLLRRSDISFIFSGYKKIDAKGVVFEEFGVPDKISYKELLKGTPISCLTAIIDTQYFGKQFMPVNTKREDYAYWLKLLKLTDFAYGYNFKKASYRVYEGQSSANKLDMAKENWRLYREVEGLNLIKASYYFSHYAVRGLLRTKVPGLARMLGVLK